MIQSLKHANKQIMPLLYDYKAICMKQDQQSVFECIDEYNKERFDLNSTVTKIEKVQRARNFSKRSR